MLNKLMKYDLKKMYKVLVVFYCLSLILAIICRVFNELGNIFAFRVLYIIFSSIEYAIIANVIVHAFVRIILRFNNNFYKDESYLTHTLPVSKQKLLLSKYLSSLIVIFSSVVIVFLSFFIMFYDVQTIEVISNFLTALSGQFNFSVAGFISLVVVSLFVQICSIISMTFYAIVLGNRANEKRALKSLLWIALVYIISIIFSLLCIFAVSAMFNVANEIFSNVVSGKTLLIVFVLAIILYSTYSIFFYFLSNRAFNNGVNVDWAFVHVIFVKTLDLQKFLL